MSLCLDAARASSCFLIDPIGPGTRALCALARRATRSHVLGPLGNGFDLDVRRARCSSAAASGWRRSRTSPRCSATSAARILGFRTPHHAEAAALVPSAEVVRRAHLRDRAAARRTRVDVLACGPEPMLEAVRGLAPRAQLAWEAPMACGYGACYGCVVEIERPPAAALHRGAGPAGRRDGRPASSTRSGCLDALTAPEVARGSSTPS